jgi:hypothetical protein
MSLGANTVRNVGLPRVKRVSVMLVTVRNGAHKLVAAATKVGRTTSVLPVQVSQAATGHPAHLKEVPEVIGGQQVDQIAVRAPTVIVPLGHLAPDGHLGLQMIVRPGRLIAMLDQVKGVFRIVPMQVVHGVHALHLVAIRNARVPGAPPQVDLRARATVSDGKRRRPGAKHVLLVVNARLVARTA